MCGLSFLMLAGGLCALLPLSRARAASVTVYDLGTLGGTNSQGFGVNNSGQVAGYSAINPTNIDLVRAFLYTGTPGVDGHMIDLGTLGGSPSYAYAINNSAQVVGSSYLSTGGVTHAFLYTGTPGSGGAMHDLGTLGAAVSESTASGINNTGQVVGKSATSSGVHAFL